MTGRRDAQCRECGQVLQVARRHKGFCASRCRMAWHNRQSRRGAQLYSLFMAWRYERAEAQRLRIWSLMARMASVWRDEDRDAGRTSYLPPQEAARANARYRATRYKC